MKNHLLTFQVIPYHKALFPSPPKKQLIRNGRSNNLSRSRKKYYYFSGSNSNRKRKVFLQQMYLNASFNQDRSSKIVTVDQKLLTKMHQRIKKFDERSGLTM